MKIYAVNLALNNVSKTFGNKTTQNHSKLTLQQDCFQRSNNLSFGDNSDDNEKYNITRKELLDRNNESYGSVTTYRSKTNKRIAKVVKKGAYGITETTEYHDNGKLKAKTTQYGRGTISSSEYDTNGRLYKKTEKGEIYTDKFQQDRVYQETCTFIKKNSENTVEETYTLNDRKPLSYTMTIKEKQNGRKLITEIRHAVFNPETGKIKSSKKVLFEYNKYGQITRQLSKQYEGLNKLQFIENYEATYNSSGNRVEEETKRENNKGQRLYYRRDENKYARSGYENAKFALVEKHITENKTGKGSPIEYIVKYNVFGDYIGIYESQNIRNFEHLVK